MAQVSPRFRSCSDINILIIKKFIIKLASRLRPFENEVVSGEMRVQITFEQTIVRSSPARHVI
jgi:hypothetical protein